MNGEAMLLIVFGIAVILLLLLILIFLVLNPIRNAKMFSQKLLDQLSPSSLVDGEALTNYANNSLNEAVDAAHLLGENVAKLATQRGIVDGVNLANAQLLNTQQEVTDRSEDNPEGTPVVDDDSAEEEKLEENNN